MLLTSVMPSDTTQRKKPPLTDAEKAEKARFGDLVRANKARFEEITKKKYTQAALAEEVGNVINGSPMTQGAIWQYLSPDHPTRLNAQIVQAVAALMGFSPEQISPEYAPAKKRAEIFITSVLKGNPGGYIPGRDSEIKDTDAHYNVTPVEIRGYIPLISWIRAGEWDDTVDPYEIGDCEKVCPTTVPHSMATFALRVDGDSMTAPIGARRSFPHGMIIYVDPEKKTPNNGDFVVARKLGTQTATFKQLTTDEGRPVLKPLNPDRSAYPIIRDEFEIIGKVIDASWGGL